MPITKDFIATIPENPGVYQFLDSNTKIIYIGKARNLRKRLYSYTRVNLYDFKSSKLVENTAHIKFTIVNSEYEALLLEARLIKHHQPKYNIIWKDDKHYIYVQITKEVYPRVLLSRKNAANIKDLYGPFPSVRIIREILKIIRQIYPYCTQSPKMKKKCFYSHLGLCYPCPGDLFSMEGKKQFIMKKAYLDNINRIKKLLNGKISEIKNDLVRKMNNNSRFGNYETAINYRDKIDLLKTLMHKNSDLNEYLTDPGHIEEIWGKEREDLIKLLNPYFHKLRQLQRIECYDISHTNTQFTVGSLITFVNNQPAKQFYRRFRIKKGQKKDDVSSLSEMIERRLKHREWIMPDLIIIDGGAPQLKALKQILELNHIKIPLIGLAKEDEKIIIIQNGILYRVKLDNHSHALHLVQRIRDEAHRFAHAYHLLLRDKYLFHQGSV